MANSHANNIGIFIGHGNGSFANQQTYPTDANSQPYSIVTGDLNHDEKLDLIVANYGTHTIGILRGNGNGSFQHQTIFSTFASRPLSMALNDVNNDTHLDLIVVNFGTNDIGVYLGDGNGSLSLFTRLFTGDDSLPSYVVIADIDHDHRSDIVVVNSGTDNVGIFFGMNGDRFTLQRIYSTGVGSRPSSVVIGDFNDDQWLDMAVIKYGLNEIGIFFGNTSRTWIETRRWTTNRSYPFRMAMGDVNGDAREDLIVLYDSNDYFSVWLGNDDGIFEDKRDYFTGFQSNAYSLITGYLNDDHRLDIATVNMLSNNVGVFLGENPITFQISNSYATVSDSYPSSIAVKDLNHDHESDVVVTNTWNDSISIFLGSTDGTLREPIVYSMEEYSRPQSVVIADFNNDSHPDLIVINSEWNSLGVFLGHGNGTFADQIILYQGILNGINSIDVGDLNDDERIDIVISRRYEGDNVQVYLGYGNGSFSTESSFSTAIGFGIQSVVVNDMNRDGRLDIIAVEIYSSTVHIFFGYGNGTFAKQATFTSNSGLEPCFLTVDDLNNDTFLDILVGYCSSSQLGISLADRGETWTSEKLYSLGDGFSPSSIVVGDFNNDTRIDLIVTSLYNYFIDALMGHGDGTFSNPVLIYNSSEDDYPSAAAKNDFNHDDRDDLIFVNYKSSTIRILLGHDFGILTNQIVHSTGSAIHPIFVEVADFNHDNQSDIAVVNAGSNTINVRFGMGDSSFRDETICPISVGAEVSSIVVGDFNRDTHLDIAVANFGHDNIGVFLGRGDRTFASEQIYSTGLTSHPLSLVVGDFNNDDWTDMAVANYGTNSIGVFFGYNYTRLVYHTSHDVDRDHGPRFIVVADLNHDRHSDMIVINYRGDSFSVFLGNTDGNFTLKDTYNTGVLSFPRTGAVGDFNLNGKLDLVITNSGQHSIMIYFGDGNGSFAKPITYSTGRHSNPQIVCVSDVNNDNQLDIVVTNKDTHNIVVFLGTINGTFRSRITYNLEVSSNLQSIVVRDFNNDRKMDIIFGDYTNNRLGLLFGYGNGSFSRRIKYIGDSSANPVSINTGDFNNDTHVDLVVINKYSNNIYVLLSYGNGSFSDPLVSVPGGDMEPTSVTVGDFNHDRLLDICVSDSGGSIIIYHGVGDGFFKHSVIYSVGYASSPEWIISGYFNRDDYLDVAVANFQISTVAIFFGNGCDPYANQLLFPLDEDFRPTFLTVGDVNNDHYADIIVVNEGTNNVIALLNNRNETFSKYRLFFNDFHLSIFSVTMANLNNDSHLDLIAVNRDNERISVFFGWGNGSFEYDTSYWIGYGSRPKAITLADFTNDTYLDIAVANDGTNNIVLFAGIGNGSFVPSISFSTGYSTLPCSLDVGDFNNDAVADVVTVMSAIDTIGIISRIC